MATAKKKPSTEIATWDAELAKYADDAAKMEAATGGGQFFSLRSGILSWQDSPLPGNEMAVVILDSIFETLYYEGEYDPDVPQSPTAFAFGRDDKTMVWHENSSPDFAGKLCCESEVCEWGSADKGKGKAARETRRLAMIPAGTIGKDGKFKMFDSIEHFETTPIGFMKLPVTSVRGFAAFVKQVAGALRRPPFGIVTSIKVVPDPKTQFKVVFEPLVNIPDELMGAIMDRHTEAKMTIDFPYTPEEVQTKPAQKGKRGAAGKTAKGRRY